MMLEKCFFFPTLQIMPHAYKGPINALRLIGSSIQLQHSKVFTFSIETPEKQTLLSMNKNYFLDAFL